MIVQGVLVFSKRSVSIDFSGNLPEFHGRFFPSLSPVLWVAICIFYNYLASLSEERDRVFNFSYGDQAHVC